MERLETIFKHAWGRGGALLNEAALWTHFTDEVDRELMFRICSLANSAGDIFCGHFPTLWPYGAILELRELPWFEDWYIEERVRRRVVENGELVELDDWELMYVLRKDVKDRFFEEVAAILDRLEKDGVEIDPFSDPVNIIPLDVDPKSRKEAIQALCSVMLCHLNGSINGLYSGDHRRSAIFLSSAYQCLSHLQIECERYSSGRVRGGVNRHRDDPKATEKALIHGCWKAWEAEPAKYPSVAAFARDMVDKVKHLKGDVQVIARWVREWKRGME